MSQYTASIQQLYVAYFGRPADAGGLTFWEGVVAAAGGKTAAISAAFAASAEYTTAFAGKSPVETVNQVYVNLFGHDADPSGLLFWANALQTKAVTIDNVVTAIAGGAQGTDKVAFESKVAAATAFTAALDTTTEILGYNTAAIPAAKAFIAGVTDEATLASAVAGVDAAVTTVVAAGTPVTPAQTFTLTTAVNTFTGGAGDDSFIADNTSTAQASAADTLVGGAGSDTLTIYGSTGGTTTPKMSGIEHVILDSVAGGGAWSFGSVTGITDLALNRSVASSTVTVNNGVAVTIADNATAASTQTVNFGSSDTSASLTLSNVNLTGGTLVETGTAVATLNVASVNAANTVGTLTTDNTVTALNVTGSQNLTVTAALNDKIAKIDATNFSGKLNVVTGVVADDGTSAVDLTVIGGSGNDTISIVNVAVGTETSVNAGAGNDTVKVTAAQIANDAGDILNGGAGTDVLSVNYLDESTGVGLLATDLSASVTGFESVTLTSDATATRTHVWAEGTVKSGVKAFTVTSADATDSFSLTGLAAASTVTVTTSEAAVSAAIGTNTAADVINFALDGTTLATLTATNYETVNIASSKDSDDVTNVLTTGAFASATKVVLTGSGALVGGTFNTAASATVDASAYTGNLTGLTLGTASTSYIGGSGKDEITLQAGELKQGNTFAGGAGTDKLTVTAASAQDMGILGLTGFETVILNTNATATDAVKADFRNVTGLTTLKVVAGDATDTLTLNRLSSDTTLSFGSSFGATVTTVNTGTTQKVAATGNFTIASLTLDSGTTSLTVTSDDGTNAATSAVFSSISGTSLTSITVAGADATSLGTLTSTVTSVSAAGATGALTVTASASNTSIVGSQAADTITGGAGDDVIQGGKGADTLSGGAGSDTYVFEATAALNGSDTITMVAGAAGDKLSFKNFLSGGSIDQNGGAGTALVAYTAAGTSDVAITNKVALYSDASFNGAATATVVADLIQGAGDTFSLASGGKAILITGDAGSSTDAFEIWYIDDSLDGVAGTVSATDVVKVGTSSAGFELDTLTTANIVFA